MPETAAAEGEEAEEGRGGGGDEGAGSVNMMAQYLL